MVYVNKPFLGQDENPLTKSVYIVSWNDDTNLPPPGSQILAAEDGDELACENNDILITE